MYKRSFRICQLNIEFTTPFELAHTDNRDAFETGADSADIEVLCETRNEICTDAYELLGKTADAKVFDCGDKIARCFCAGTVDAAVSKFNPNGASKVEVSVLDKMWSTVMDERYMWSTIALPQIIASHNGLVLHASYIEVGGRALLFSAPSGTGKSTQAALWEKYRGAEIINGDKTAVRVADGKVTAHGLPFAGTSGICKNRSLPLGAVVLLKQAPENTVRKLGGAEAIAAIMQNVYLDLISTDEHRQAMNTVLDIAQNVPVYELGCTPDERAVQTLENELNL